VNSRLCGNDVWEGFKVSLRSPNALSF
jgi:hypothetical protein